MVLHHRVHVSLQQFVFLELLAYDAVGQAMHFGPGHAGLHGLHHGLLGGEYGLVDDALICGEFTVDWKGEGEKKERRMR